MGQAFTREVCGACGVIFDVPMQKERGIGYAPGSAVFSLSYDQDEGSDINIEPCCPVCASAITVAARTAFELIGKIEKE